MNLTLREAVSGAWQIGELLMGLAGPTHRVNNLRLLISYGLSVGRMTVRTKPVNVDELVEQWAVAVVGMCTAHSKDEYDAHDATADKLLSPILTAPIKQVREFYNKLRTRLHDDPNVPMLVWMGFEAWGESAIAGAPDDESIKRLKNKLAADIAELVEEDVRDQIPKAIARALRWRDEERLTEIKEQLETGAKPKLVGRQSCLFLEVGRGKKKTSVML